MDGASVLPCVDSGVGVVGGAINIDFKRDFIEKTTVKKGCLPGYKCN